MTDRTIEGEIPLDRQEDFADGLRAILEQPLFGGALEVVGRSFAWKTPARSGRDLDLSIRSRDGVTTIHLEEDLRNARASVKVVTWVSLVPLALLVSVALSVAAQSVLVAALLVPLTILAGVLLSKQSIRTTTARRTEEIERKSALIGDLVRRVASTDRLRIAVETAEKDVESQAESRGRMQR